MYICPTCGLRLEEENDMRNHMLRCWNDLHPYHKSKPAPHSEDITYRVVDDDVLDFFNALNNREKND